MTSESPARPETDGVRPHRRVIVVGVDGSANSLAALRLAAAEAAVDGAKLKAVYAYGPHVPVIAKYGELDAAQLSGRFDYPPINAPLIDDAERAGLEMLDRAAHEVFGDLRPPGLQLVAEGGAAPEVLIQEAQDADLLVVGARGHAGPLAFLLGSTAQFCARHAPCPVLVVPATEPMSSVVGAD